MKTHKIAYYKETGRMMAEFYLPAYECTVEFVFLKSKQRCGSLDENRTVILKRIILIDFLKTTQFSFACGRSAFFDSLGV